MGKKDRKSMEDLWSKRFDEEAEDTEDGPLSRKAKREREKSISPILTVTLIFMALLIILPTSAYLWWSSRESLSEEPTGPSIEQVMKNNEEVEEQLEEDDEINDPEDDELELADSDKEDSSVNDEEIDKNSAELLTSAEEENSEAASVADDVVSESAPETNANNNTQNQDTESSSQSNDEEKIEESTETTEIESTPENTSAQNVNFYNVKSGDNMYRIALNHGMTTEELMQLNNIQDETVQVGQELRVE